MAGDIPPALPSRIASDTTIAVGPPTQFTDLRLPHTWDAVSVFYPNPGTERRTVGYYSTTFDVPDRGADDRVFVHFGSVFLSAEVWVNGQPAGTGAGAYLPFAIDITDAIDHGTAPHTLTVRVDSRPRDDLPPPARAGWYAYGGIDRPVSVVVVPGVRLDDFATWGRVTFPGGGGADVALETALINTTGRKRTIRLVATLVGPDGDPVGSAERDVRVPRTGAQTVEIPFERLSQVLRWSPRTPHLYQLRVEAFEQGRLVDELRVPLGFRELTFDPDTGLYLNGEPIELRGMNAHQEYPGYGSAVPAELQRRDVRLLHRLGANFLRTSHYPRDPSVLALCDTLGIMVLEELPLWHASIRAAGGPALEANLERLFRTMVRRDRVHPSVIIWNLGNEVLHNAGPEDHETIVRIMEHLAQVADEEDPDRWTSMVVGASWDVADSLGITQLTDLVGYNGRVLAVPGLVDLLHERYPQRRAFMSEGPGGGRRGELYLDLLEIAEDVETMQKQASRPWFPQGAYWCLFDYGLPLVDRWQAPGMRLTGVYDHERIPKDSAAFFRSQWTEEPMVQILGHWTWPGQEGWVRDVWVVSNADTVALTLNGVLVGLQGKDFDQFPRLAHPPFGFEVAYEPGTLVATAWKDGAAVAADTAITSGPASRIVLTAESPRVTGDRPRAVPVHLQVLDPAGNPYYTANIHYDVEVTGPARLVRIPNRPAIWGEGAFVVETDGIPGQVSVRATADGLAPGVTTIDVTPLEDGR